MIGDRTTKYRAALSPRAFQSGHMDDLARTYTIAQMGIRDIYEAELTALRKKMAEMEGAGSGDSLEMMANELMRGINEVEVGNQAQAAALLRVLRMRMMKAASLNPKEQA